MEMEKEILRNQLKLLAERSKEASEIDLMVYTEKMCEIVRLLAKMEG